MGLLRRHREPEPDPEPEDTANAALANELRSMARRLNELADGMAEVHGLVDYRGDNEPHGNHP